MMKRLAHSGFTLTELAIVLGIVGIVLGAIWTGTSAVNESRKAARAVAQIHEISNNIKDLFAMQSRISVSGSQLMLKLFRLKVFPADLMSTGQLTNSWNGNVWISSNVLGNDTYRISYYGIPPSACAQIANGVITGAGTMSANPVNMIINGGGAAPISINLTTNSIDLATLAANCAANSNPTTSSLEFDFKLTK